MIYLLLTSITNNWCTCRGENWHKLTIINYKERSYQYCIVDTYGQVFLNALYEHKKITEYEWSVKSKISNK